MQDILKEIHIKQAELKQRERSLVLRLRANEANLANTYSDNYLNNNIMDKVQLKKLMDCS